MRGTGVIVSGELRLDIELAMFIMENDDCELDVEIKVLNKPEHYLYKFLWGYLYEDMSMFMQEPKEQIHDELKVLFAKEFVNDWTDVPRRHRKKCERYELVHDNGAVEKYYIKSTSSMTHEEMKDYLQRVEYHYYEFLGGNRDSEVKKGFHLRVQGMMDAKQLKKHRKEGMK